jgi:hypothetical protein
MNNCFVTDSFKLHHFERPSILLSGDTVACIGEVIVMSVQNFNNYLWSTGENTQSIQTDTSGSFFVTVTDFHGCEWTDSLDVLIASCDNVEEENSAFSLIAYPNPFQKFVFFESTKDIQRIEVYDIKGQLIINATIDNNQINVSELNNGLYLFVLYFKDNSSLTIKMQKF